ncbi:MAG: peptidoglycan recognition protein family protein [Kofleriaceae bacterium]
MSGLLFAGREVEVPGARVLNARDEARLRLDARDYRQRSTQWIRQGVIHTTKGIWPQRIAPGAGPAGRHIQTFRSWIDDPERSAAHIVIGSDGLVACLADLVRHCAFHAGAANDLSWGIELHQEGDGTIYAAQLDALARIVPVICRKLGMPFQIAADPYKAGSIIKRLRHAAPDVVGIYGHRDQAWREPQYLTPEQRRRYPDGYAARGRGDPGDHVYTCLHAAGAEPLRYAELEDLAVWRRRQERLVRWGAQLGAIDGIAGPATMRAMRAMGFASGREIDVATAPRPAV